MRAVASVVASVVCFWVAILLLWLLVYLAGSCGLAVVETDVC